MNYKNVSKWKTRNNESIHKQYNLFIIIEILQEL